MRLPGGRRVRQRVCVRSLALGFGFGFVVAMQLGPMSLFLIRSTLRSGAVTGLSIGAGVAVVDGLYAALGSAGAASLLTIGPLRMVLGVVGAVVLAALGLRTLADAFRVRGGMEIAADLATPRRALLTSLAGTASNPLTIVSWAAIFAAASVGTQAQPVPLVIGVAAGSLTWMSALTLGVALVRRAAGPRAIRVADVMTGAGMLGFAGFLGYRSAHSS